MLARAKQVGEKEREAYVARMLGHSPGVTVAVSDYMKVLPESIAPPPSATTMGASTTASLTMGGAAAGSVA